jgi:hypothetical protein
MVRHPLSVGESSRGGAEPRKGGEVFHRDFSSTTTRPSTNKSAPLPLLSASPRLRVSSSRCLKAAHGQTLSVGESSRGGAEPRKGGEVFHRDFSSTTTRPSTNKSAPLPLLSASPRLRVSSSRCLKAAHGQTLSVGESSRGGAEPRKGGEVFHRDFSSTTTRPSTNKSAPLPLLSASPRLRVSSSRCLKAAHGHAADCAIDLQCAELSGIAGVAKSGGMDIGGSPPTPRYGGLMSSA